MLQLSRDGGETLTRQLTDQLRDLITGGRLAPGQLLPSSRHLAQSLDLSRNTVSFAIKQLRRGRLLTRSPPDAVRRWPRACRSMAANLIARRPCRRSINLSSWARDLALRTGRRSTPGVRVRSGRAYRRREFPHDLFEPLHLRRAARNALLARGSVRRPSAAAAGPAAGICRFVRHQGQARSDPDRADGGSGLALVAAALLERGDHAWIESPGYGGAYVALKAAGAVVSAIRLDEHGMTVGARKDAPRLIFVTPSHQYPTGRLMPIGRRLELLRYAEAVGRLHHRGRL